MAIRPISSEERKDSRFSVYENVSDDQLITALQTGDDKAFETLMNRHRGLIWRVAKQYLGNLNDAEDLFQDISLTFYQNRQMYQPGAAKFSSWLYRVAVNRCIDLMRAKQYQSKEKELDDSIPSRDLNSEDRLGRGQIFDQLRALVETLPMQQKLALSLYYYEERNISDISGHLEISEVAARALIKRGKEKLRDMSGFINP